MANKTFIYVLVVFLVIFIAFSCFDSSNNEAISSSYLNGTWSTISPEELNMTHAYDEQFGWGIGKSVTNSTIYFDLIKKVMYVDWGLDMSRILGVESLDKNTYKVIGAKYNDEGEEFRYFYIIQFLTKDKIVMKFGTELENVFGQSQELSKIYYRISGPGTAIKDK